MSVTVYRPPSYGEPIEPGQARPKCGYVEGCPNDAQWVVRSDAAGPVVEPVPTCGWHLPLTLEAVEARAAV